MGYSRGYSPGVRVSTYLEYGWYKRANHSAPRLAKLGLLGGFKLEGSISAEASLELTTKLQYGVQQGMSFATLGSSACLLPTI